MTIQAPSPAQQRLAADFAARFIDKTRSATVRVHPTDEHLRLAFSRSVRPPEPVLYPLIRAVLARDWT